MTQTRLFTRAVPKLEASRPKSVERSLQGHGVLQRKCACGGSSSTGSECDECKKKDASTLQRKTAKTLPQNATIAPPIVHDVLRSPGKPLDESTRAFFEPRFGHDFGRVRVHTDEKAVESARALNALAYTVGHDIVFGKELFAPHTDVGRGLLGHELTHVVQNGGAHAGGRIELGSSSSEAETEAEANSTRSLARPITVQDRGAVLRRQQAKPQSCSGWTCLADLNKCDSPDPGKEGNGQPSTSWMLTAMIDVDVPTPEEVGITTFGHSYVRFTESNGAEYTFGFYPRTQAEVVLGAARNTPGCIVHPDLTHLPCVDYQEKFQLQKSEYDKALDNAKKWCHASPGYHLFDVNCTTFVAKVVESAGKTLPTYRGKVTEQGITADNPNTLLESLQSRDKATEQANAAREKSRAAEQKRARDKEQADLAAKLRQIASKTPPEKAQLTPPPPSGTPLLASPGTAQPAPSWDPFSGGPGRSPLQDARDSVAKGKEQTKDLLTRGEQLLSGSPSKPEIDKFKQDEEIWRMQVTYMRNYFTDHGADEGQRGFDELLNSDQYGGRLRIIRQNLGG